MLLIAITIAAGVSYYVYSTKLLGSLEGANGPVTMDNLRIEAYNWDSLNSLLLNVRNIGTNVLNFNSADWFVGGVKMSVSVTNPTGGTCTTNTAVSPGTLCLATATISGLTVNSGIVYVVKIVLRDGAIFSISAIAGQVTGQTGVP
jgi:hypothetical protein